MMQELAARDLRKPSVGEEAYRKLPPITKNLISHWMDCLSLPADERSTEFQAILRNKLLSSEWEKVVSLMQSLTTPEAAIAFARRRYDRERELTGIRGDGRGTIPNAQVVLDTLRLHISLTHHEGTLQRDGVERHVKHGIHAPFEEFTHPVQFMNGFEKGVAIVTTGKNHSIVVPSMEFGAVVILSKKRSPTRVILQTTGQLMPEQVSFLKEAHTYGKFDAVIMHGKDSFPTRSLRRQLQSGVARGGGHVEDIRVPLVKFDVAIDSDRDVVVFDSKETPEWIAADMESLNLLNAL